MLQTIGTTFSNLAEFAEAEKALRASLDLRVAAAGPKSAEAAESLVALSQMYALCEEVSTTPRRARARRSRSRAAFTATRASRLPRR